MLVISLLAWSGVAVSSAIIETVLTNHDRRGAPAGSRAMDRVMVLMTMVALVVPLALVEPVPLPIAAIGLVCALAGVGLRTWAILSLGLRYVLTPRPVSSRPVVQRRGPYALVRHPGYLGLLAQLLGMGVMLSPVAAALAMVPLVYCCTLRITGEERMLRRELSEYARYQSDVRWKLLPWIL